MIVIERWYRPNCTLGTLRARGFYCFTLELPWLDNKNSISCIPEGDYEYFLRKSRSNGIVLELKNVPSRTFIQVHSGNFIRQIKGCILVGDGIKYLDGDNIPDVSNSRNTLRKLIDTVPTEGKISIRGNYNG